jgi:hypothetical protein
MISGALGASSRTPGTPRAQAEIRRAVAVLRTVKERKPTVNVWVEPVRDPSSPPLGALCGGPGPGWSGG